MVILTYREIVAGFPGNALVTGLTRPLPGQHLHVLVWFGGLFLVCRGRGDKVSVLQDPDVVLAKRGDVHCFCQDNLNARHQSLGR